MSTATSILLARAVSLGLSEIERGKLSPTMLAQLAVGGHITLSPADRRRLPRTTLALLAIGGFIELTRYERDSFNSQTLALLAASGRVILQPSEFARLPSDLQAVAENETAMRQVPKRPNPVIEGDLGLVPFYHVSQVRAEVDC
jgi:hypothetical protein